MCDKKRTMCPPHFRYKDVLVKGKPTHDKYDSFSLKHPAMSLVKRAKIFSPFDALKGFNEAVAAKEIIYEDRRSPSEDDARLLDQKLGILHSLTQNSNLARENRVMVSVTYFVPCDDPNNTAFQVQGRYETITGTLQKVDLTVTKTISLDVITIDLFNIFKIESPIFDTLETL